MVNDPDFAVLEELRALAQAASNAQIATHQDIARRDQAITAAFEGGVSPTKIARAINRNRQIVYRIAKRTGAKHA